MRVGCFDGVIVDDFLPKFYEHIRSVEIQMKLSRGSFEENRRALENDEIDILFTLSVDFNVGLEYNVRKVVQRKGAIIYSKSLLQKNVSQVEISDFKDYPLLIMPRSMSAGLYDSALANLKTLGIDHPIYKQKGEIRKWQLPIGTKSEPRVMSIRNHRKSRGCEKSPTKKERFQA